MQISILFAQECFTLPIEECADYWYCNLDGDECADNTWSLFINSTNQDVETNEGNDQFHLGMCSECSDNYNVWEELVSLSPAIDPSIDLFFYHPEYFGISEHSEFNTDYRSVHSPEILVSWDIAADIVGVNSVQLEWNFNDFLPQEYEIYLFDGNTGYNMRELSGISLPKEAFNLNGNETNIKLRIGVCAETGTTTYYFDNDNDGWGGDQSNEFCLGYAPEGWVANAGDLNDDLFCESNLIDNCNVCDGFNQDIDCNGVCFGTSVLDECSVCDGDGVQQECGCGSPGEFGIPDGDCDCNGNIDDCAGVCGGTSTLETLCEDTDGDGLGNPGSETEQCIDLGRDIMSGCDLPDLNLYLSSDGSVFYKSSEPINGFQFDVVGASVLDASGGDAGAADFIISANSLTVIAFSFTGITIDGCGTLINLELNGEATGLNNIVISDNTGSPIPFYYYQEDEIDLVLDCSDEYPDCSYNFYDCFDYCGGSAEIDECGVCGGNSPAEGYNCNGTPELFIHNNSSLQAFYFFTTVMIDDVAIDLDDWVGVFNGDICVGSRQWDTSECGGGVCDVPVYGYDGSEYSEGYMQSGEVPIFKIFNASENAYYNATPSDDIPWSNNAYNWLDSLEAISVTDYCIDLHSGANLISFYALPEDVSVQSVMAPLGENVSGVITEGGACSQISPGNWVGSQCSLSPEKGYWVILNSNIDLCLSDAYFTDPAFLYDLHSGANLISFPSEFSALVSNALPDDIEAAITGVITEGGACSQITPGNWVGSQCSFNGGKGYWVITTKSIEFSFDFNTHGRIKSQNSIGLIFPNGFEVWQSSQQAFYFIENLILDNQTSNEGWILAYHGSTLVGARQWKGEIIDIPIMGNDGYAYSKGYLETGDIPSFKYLDQYSGKLTNLYNTDTPQWENNGMFILTALESRNVVPQNIALNTYPNPFNPVTTLSFSVPNEGMLQLSIYNISGQLVSELAHELHTPGNYNYSWNADAFSSGVYFARLNINNTFYTQKLVLMK